MYELRNPDFRPDRDSLEVEVYDPKTNQYMGRVWVQQVSEHYLLLNVHGFSVSHTMDTLKNVDPEALERMWDIRESYMDPRWKMVSP